MMLMMMFIRVLKTEFLRFIRGRFIPGAKGEDDSEVSGSR